MLIIVWEYVVKPDRLEEFESMYRPDGPWTELLRKSPGFVSTTLMRDVRDPSRFIVADRWTSEAQYEQFKLEHAVAYGALSERGERLYRLEHPIGRFDFLE